MSSIGPNVCSKPYLRIIKGSLYLFNCNIRELCRLINRKHCIIILVITWFEIHLMVTWFSFPTNPRTLLLVNMRSVSGFVVLTSVSGISLLKYPIGGISGSSECPLCWVITSNWIWSACWTAFPISSSLLPANFFGNNSGTSLLSYDHHSVFSAIAMSETA